VAVDAVGRFEQVHQFGDGVALRPCAQTRVDRLGIDEFGEPHALRPWVGPRKSSLTPQTREHTAQRQAPSPCRAMFYLARADVGRRAPRVEFPSRGAPGWGMEEQRPWTGRRPA